MGALLTGLLASKEANPLVEGLSQGLLGAQVAAIFVTLLLSVVATAIIAFLVKAVVGLRADEEVETIGLDLSEHGEEGYHGA
jgi:Amt family ammonium transporter